MGRIQTGLTGVNCRVLSRFTLHKTAGAGQSSANAIWELYILTRPFTARPGNFAEIGHRLGQCSGLKGGPRRAPEAIDARLARETDLRDGRGLVNETLHMFPRGAETCHKRTRRRLRQLEASIHFSGRSDEEPRLAGMATETRVLVQGRFAERGFVPIKGGGAVSSFESDGVFDG